MAAAGKKPIDFARVLQITLSVLALLGIIIQGGRVLERVEASRSEIIELIRHNEQLRDLKDQGTRRDVDDLSARLKEEMAERKKIDEKLERLERLYLVRFGQTTERDK